MKHTLSIFGMFVITFINYYHRHHHQHYSSSLAVKQTFSWLSKYVVEISFLHEIKPKNNKVQKGSRIKYNMRKKTT